MNPAVVVSFYDRRPLEPLRQLLDSLDQFDAGLPARRILVVNATGGQSLPHDVRNRFDVVVERPNTGMNIGAWDAGWRAHQGHSHYLFLQDECLAVREGWMRAVVDRIDSGAGIVGESLNRNWDRPWDELRDRMKGPPMPEHLIEGVPSGDRVAVYLHHIRRFGVDPGASGVHLRSLVWGLSGAMLEALGGFPQGSNYGECIAAEIGVSRAVVAQGGRIEELGPVPFHWFRHQEWNQDVPGGPFTHKPLQLREMQRLKEALAAERARVPEWAELSRWVIQKVRQAVSGGRA